MAFKTIIIIYIPSVDKKCCISEAKSPEMESLEDFKIFSNLNIEILNNKFLLSDSFLDISGDLEWELLLEGRWFLMFSMMYCFKVYQILAHSAY